MTDRIDEITVYTGEHEGSEYTIQRKQKGFSWECDCGVHSRRAWITIGAAQTHHLSHVRMTHVD